MGGQVRGDDGVDAAQAPLVIFGVFGLDRHVVYALFGGGFTAIAPVMLWIAFVLRPDQRPGQGL